MFKLYLLVAAPVMVTWQGCCPTKVVSGQDDLAGTYTFYEGPANFLDICQ